MGNVRSDLSENSRHEVDDSWWSTPTMDAQQSEQSEQSQPREDLNDFKQELERKHEKRRQIIAEKRKEMMDLREELERCKKENEELKAVRSGDVENEALKLQVEQLKLELRERDELVDKNREMRINIAEMQTELQELNTEFVAIQQERLEYSNHISALKDVVRVTKDMLGIRETQIEDLHKKVKSVEELLASKEMKFMSEGLREEYEKQLRNIRNLRMLYEERQRLDKVDKEHLQAQLEQSQKQTEEEQKKNSELLERIAELEKDNSNKYDSITSLQSNLGLTKAECKELQAEINIINQLFSEILLGFNNSQEVDLDKLVKLLEENHDLLTNMVTNEESDSTAAALPKLLLDLINQTNKEDLLSTKDDTADTQPCSSHQLNSVTEIVANLPKVWKVLIELLSHQSPPSNDISDDKADPCYTSIETPTGPKQKLSVSQTFIRLKDLIMEKKFLERESYRLKHLNSHLESRLQDQEKRLGLVSGELKKTWHVVGKMQRQHQQLHTHEKVLRYELQQKRKLLVELKEELQYCREKWVLAREKNDTTQEQWKELRKEFAARKTVVLDDFNQSAESGYSDDKDSSEDERGYESDVEEVKDGASNDLIGGANESSNDGAIKDLNDGANKDSHDDKTELVQSSEERQDDNELKQDSSDDKISKISNDNVPTTSRSLEDNVVFSQSNNLKSEVERLQIGETSSGSSLLKSSFDENTSLPTTSQLEDDSIISDQTPLKLIVGNNSLEVNISRLEDNTLEATSIPIAVKFINFTLPTSTEMVEDTSGSIKSTAENTVVPQEIVSVVKGMTSEANISSEDENFTLKMPSASRVVEDDKEISEAICTVEDNNYSSKSSSSVPRLIDDNFDLLTTSHLVEDISQPEDNSLETAANTNSDVDNIEENVVSTPNSSRLVVELQSSIEDNVVSPTLHTAENIEDPTFDIIERNTEQVDTSIVHELMECNQAIEASENEVGFNLLFTNLEQAMQTTNNIICEREVRAACSIRKRSAGEFEETYAVSAVDEDSSACGACTSDAIDEDFKIKDVSAVDIDMSEQGSCGEEQFIIEEDSHVKVSIDLECEVKKSEQLLGKEINNKQQQRGETSEIKILHKVDSSENAESDSNDSILFTKVNDRLIDPAIFSTAEINRMFSDLQIIEDRINRCETIKRNESPSTKIAHKVDAISKSATEIGYNNTPTTKLVNSTCRSIKLPSQKLELPTESSSSLVYSTDRVQDSAVTPVSNSKTECSEVVQSISEKTVDVGCSSMSKISTGAIPKQVVPTEGTVSRNTEAMLSAREARLQRLERECKALVSKVTNTSQKSVNISNKLDDLHGIYGATPVNTQNEGIEDKVVEEDVSKKSSED